MKPIGMNELKSLIMGLHVPLPTAGRCIVEALLLKIGEELV